MRTALISAAEQITKLADSVGGDAAQILEFQVALLEDDDLLDPIFSAIAGGVPAHTAWSAALDAQIGDYNTADEYLRARSSDLADLRDRVLRILSGGNGEALRHSTRRRGVGRRFAAVAIPGNRLVVWWRPCTVARQSDQPRCHVSEGARHSDDRTAWLRALRTPALRCSTVTPPRSSSIRTPNRLRLFERRRDFFRKEPCVFARHSGTPHRVLGRGDDKTPDQHPARRRPRACGRGICRWHRPDAHRISARAIRIAR